MRKSDWAKEKGNWFTEASGPNQKAPLSNYVHWRNEYVLTGCRFHCVGTARQQNTKPVMRMDTHMVALTARLGDKLRL
jgi:hypothetical protein